MKLSVSRFNDILLYANANIQKTIKSVVNESDNASVVALYEDSAILLDHRYGQFYTCKYNFNPKNGVIVFESFEEIELENDDSNLKEAIYNYFDDDDTAGNIEAMKEAFEDNMINNDSFFKSIISESLAGKNFENVIDYSDIENINEEVSEVTNMAFFKNYKDRINKRPMTSIKHFNWKDSVKVSLIENENNRTISSNAKAKAINLSKDVDFKKDLIEAFEGIYDGDYDMAVALIEEYPGLFLLDKAQRKEVIGKSILTKSTLLENRNKLIKAFEELYETDERLEEVRNIIYEAEENAEAEADNSVAGGAKPAVETGEEGEDDSAKELTDEEAEKLIKALEAALEKTDDNKLINKIESLQKAVEDGKETGTDPTVVKECVQLLMF